MKKYIVNRAGVPILNIKGQRVPVTPKRTIRQNLAITSTYTRKAVGHDSVLSGGVRE